MSEPRTVQQTPETRRHTDRGCHCPKRPWCLPHRAAEWGGAEPDECIVHAHLPHEVRAEAAPPEDALRAAYVRGRLDERAAPPDALRALIEAAVAVGEANVGQAEHMRRIRALRDKAVLHWREIAALASPAAASAGSIDAERLAQAEHRVHCAYGDHPSQTAEEAHGVEAEAIAHHYEASGH